MVMAHKLKGNNMKHGVIFLTGTLLCGSVFAKGFIEHITHVKKHKIAPISTKHVDFSGHWVGHCQSEDKVDTINLDIKQIENKISVSMDYADTAEELKTPHEYTFNTVKLENSGSPNTLENAVSYAEWQDYKTVSLEYNRTIFSVYGSGNTYNTRMMMFEMYSMALDGDKLTVFYPDYNDDDGQTDNDSCVFQKEG